MQQFKLEKGKYIRALTLMGLDQMVMEAGGDLTGTMRDVGLDPGVLEDVDRLISFRAVNALIERCAVKYDIPNLGLIWSKRMQPAHPQTGPLMALAHFSSTARDWLTDALDYLAYHSNAYTYELIEDVAPDLAVLREKSFLVGLQSRQYSEHVMANIALIGHQGFGVENGLARCVRFRHSRPRDISLHEEIFGCPVEFDCEHNEVMFFSAATGFRTGGRFTPFRPLVRRYVQARIDRLEFYDVGVATNVALTLTSLIGTGRTDLASIASAMEVSPKKLQRLLADEGTNFSEVAEGVRGKLAQEMIAEPASQVGKVASFLGYSGNAAFTLAFKKWTGLSPLQWRKAQGSKG